MKGFVGIEGMTVLKRCYEEGEGSGSEKGGRKWNNERDEGTKYRVIVAKKSKIKRINQERIEVRRIS